MSDNPPSDQPAPEPTVAPVAPTDAAPVTAATNPPISAQPAAEPVNPPAPTEPAPVEPTPAAVAAPTEPVAQPAVEQPPTEVAPVAATENAPPVTETATVPSETATPPPAAEPVPEPKKEEPAVVTGPSIGKLTPEQESKFMQDKSYLLKSVDSSGANLYDHLSLLLQKILEERPANPFDNFEAISVDRKKASFRPNITSISSDTPSSIQDAEQKSKIVETAKIQLKLYEGPAEFDENGKPIPVPEPTDANYPDIMDLAHLFSWGGVSLGTTETFKIFLSIQKLVAAKPLKSVRLFGKIFGTKADYIIVESEVKDGETLAEDEAEAAAAEEAAAQELQKEMNKPAEDENAEKAAQDEGLDNLPKPQVQVQGPLTSEKGSGVNKYRYWVCNFPGGTWTLLKDVTPDQVQASRKIKKFFTGNLETKITSYPPFPGNEAAYLRCQIARIAAGTVISPAGYYSQDAEEGDEENEAVGNIVINEEYEGHPNDELAIPVNWVHHMPYILPQGRVAWAPHPKPEKEDKGDEDEEKEDEEPAEEEEREPAAAILTPIAEDTEHNAQPAWSIKVTSPLSTAKFSPVLVKSNRWPGAFAIGYNDKFANIYIGFGHKENVGGRFISQPTPALQTEYVLPEESEIKLTEDNDPTLEEEKEEERKKKEAEEEKAEAAEEENEEPAEEDESGKE